MLHPAWVVSMAHEFIERSGIDLDSYPRDLQTAIMGVYPIAIVILPQLEGTIANIWLESRGASGLNFMPQDHLLGALVVRAGHGIIFLDGTAPEDQRRFTLAHELAHFMVLYDRPLRQIKQLLGDTTAESHELVSEFKIEDEISIILSDLPRNVGLHYLDYDSVLTFQQENLADLVAVELLAPANVAIALAQQIAAPLFASRIDALKFRIQSQFGLPASVARNYSEALLQHVGKGMDAKEWLGLSNF